MRTVFTATSGSGTMQPSCLRQMVRWRSRQRGVYAGGPRCGEASSWKDRRAYIRAKWPSTSCTSLSSMSMRMDGPRKRARTRTEIRRRVRQEGRSGRRAWPKTYMLRRAACGRSSPEHQYTTFWADYAKGWSQGAVPIAGPSLEIPADRPPTQVYAAFPTYYIPPFHYRNPVSWQAPSCCLKRG